MKSPIDREANARAIIKRLQGTLIGADHAIRSLYQVPIKITIVIRIPGLTRGDTVFGDDDPAEAIRAIERVVKDRGGLLNGS